MARKFIDRIPKIPLWARERYDIPEEYSMMYEEKGVSDPNKQKVLFYASQFGGVRFKKIPSYLKKENEFLSKWFKTEQRDGFIRLKANTDFISELGNIKIQPLLRRRYKWECYDDEFLLENYMRPEDARKIEDFEYELNRFYSSLRINLDTPNSGITCKDRVDLTRFNAIPHIGYKPKSGGRLFHSGPGKSYQNISSSLRPFLTINGKKTTEIDISAATIQFLSIALGKHSRFKDHLSEFSCYKNLRGSEVMYDVDDYKKAIHNGDDDLARQIELTHEDPYQYFLHKINSVNFKKTDDREINLDRNSLKSLLFTLIYSPLDSQKRNVGRFLKLQNQNFTYLSLENEFPRFFKAVEAIKSIPFKFNGNDDSKHPAHILIFQEEARYAREVLQRSCIKSGIPVVPIHDSFITPVEHYDDLEQIVRGVSKELYGYILAHKKKF